MSRLGRATGTQRAQKANDAYFTTDPRPVQRLAPFLAPGSRFAEPCAGNGDLIGQLERLGHCCEWGLDVAPPLRRWPIGKGNALAVTLEDLAGVDMFITNPPWTRSLLHALIEHLASMLPTWLLFDASWMHTEQAARFEPFCTDVVSVGRVKWFEDSEHGAFDDCAWYRFDARPGPHLAEKPRFHFRAAAPAASAQMRLI